MRVLSLKYWCFTAFNSKNQNPKVLNQYDTNSFQSVLGSLTSNPEKKKRNLYRDKLIVLLYLIATEQKNYCKLQT